MHRRIIMSHNIVSEIKKIPSRIKIDTPTTFCRNITSIITYCAGCVPMTYEPIHYVHLNPFPVWNVGMEDICRGKRLQVQRASICWSVVNWVLRQFWEPICICETVICGMLFTYGYSIPGCSLRHCDFPLTLSCISISSPNVAGPVACANWSNPGWMTTLTINMAVLDLKSYKWCKMKNWSHSTSGCSREHVSPCFEYKGRQWNK